MITFIDYHLPAANGGAAFFRQWQSVMGQLENVTITDEEILISSPVHSTATRFILNNTVDDAFMAYMDGHGNLYTVTLPSYAQAWATHELDDFQERLLALSKTRVDHTGLILGNSPNRQALWQKLVMPLSKHERLHDYPHEAPEYDPKTMRWLFYIPRSNDPVGENDHKPHCKFELVCDKDGPDHAVLQVDIETPLFLSTIRDKLPESTTLPGLEDKFRSLSFPTPWPSLPVLRMDIRAIDASLAGKGWRTGLWILEKGQKIQAPDAPQLKIP